jgi:hypothetical protein
MAEERKRRRVEMQKILNVFNQIDNKIQTIDVLGLNVLVLLCVTMYPVLVTSGLIQTIYAALFTLVLAYGLATAWYIYRANETKFSIAWCVLLMSYWLPTLALRSNDIFSMTMGVLACMSVGGIPIIFVCKMQS